MQASVKLEAAGTVTDLNVPQVAAELGLHYDTVRRLLLGAHLPGYKADQKQWRVTRAALNNFKSQGGVKPVGRPKAEQSKVI